MDKCKNVYVRLNGNPRKECLSLTGRTREGLIGEVKLKLNLEGREGVFQAYKVVGKRSPGSWKNMCRSPEVCAKPLSPTKSHFHCKNLQFKFILKMIFFLRMT